MTIRADTPVIDDDYRGTPVAPPAPSPTRVRLGEELPIFCERCGYSLHGLSQIRCEQCGVLHFACPECNHHQPINTLRPAAQRVLGRLRAWWLAVSVLFRIAYFGLLLLAWFVMGGESSYRYDYSASRPVVVKTTTPSGVPAPPPVWRQPRLVPAPVQLEVIISFVAFGLAFGLVSRMLLLRWRRGWLVGLVLAAVVFTVCAGGAWFRRQTAYLDFQQAGNYTPPPAPDASFYATAGAGALCVVLGAAIVWGAWTALAHLFLPRKTAAALLDWQRSLSGRESSLAR